MSFKIRYEPRVDEDLELIREFLERFPDASPSRTLKEIVTEIRKLKTWPNSHPHFEDNPRLRKLSVGNYNALYRVDEERKLSLSSIYVTNPEILKRLSIEKHQL